jgi:hypothetical protein
MFDSYNTQWGFPGSQSWNREVFELAYYRDGGPFERVCQRLSRDFSVLVHLPGNCMAAAADTVRHSNADWMTDWLEQGLPSQANQDIAQIWKQSMSLFNRIKGWLSRVGAAAPPRVIFHNLDLLTDAHGANDPSNEAKTALFYLTDCARSGVVLGLSDSDAGELPRPLRRPFAEEIWLGEVPVERFLRLIPKRLVTAIDPGATEVDGGVAWLIAQRLRWTDPIRAVHIMDAAAETLRPDGSKDDAARAARIEHVLQEIRKATRTVEYLDPADIEPIPTTGFDPDTINLLEANVIRPFREWAAFRGAPEACRRELRRLAPGLILYGPPGTGKTRLARWIAAEIKLPIRLANAAEIKDPYWGQSESNVRRLFAAARRAAPCVLVLDDADDLLPDRAVAQGSLAGAERAIVNAFLQEMEGFRGPLEGVLVILTTNRYAALDRAARDRLHIHARISYPLTKRQVGEVVDTTAAAYGLDVTVVREDLVDFFWGSVSQRAVGWDPNDADERWRREEDLFSPREIAAAMRLLASAQGRKPNAADVERIKEHLRRQAPLAP